MPIETTTDFPEKLFRLPSGFVSGSPKYTQISLYFVDLIENGNLAHGSFLPTEKTLARSFGVSLSTLRQAFSNLETKGLVERVQGRGTQITPLPETATVEATGNSQSNAFALILPDSNAGFYPELQQSFESACSRVHRHMIVCSTHNDIHAQGDIILRLLHEKVSGVAIVTPTNSPTPAYHIEQLQNAGVPVVFCHRNVSDVSAPFISIPFKDIGALGAKTLIERGHRNFAFIGQAPSFATQCYLEGFRETMSDAGLTLDDNHCVFVPRFLTDPSAAEESLPTQLEVLFQSSPHPSAIFTTFDPIAESTYLSLTRMGKMIPDDVALLTVGGTKRIQPIQQRISAITVDVAEIGKLAVDYLQEMKSTAIPLESEKTEVAQIQLYEGMTLGS